MEASRRPILRRLGEIEKKQPKTKAAEEKFGKREKFRIFLKKKFEDVKSFDHGSEPRNRSRNGQTVREQR